MNKVSLPNSDFINVMPSFTIQSLLDQMPGQNFETDDFMAETITSKYFTPSEFVASKLPPNKFSMLHINIASLSKHVVELRSFINILEHPFDVIGITETRLSNTNPLVNIDIDGYVFKHTPTKTRCGGTGIYIKSCYEFEVHKNVIIGSIYRHHTPSPKFINTFFKDGLGEVSKHTNKICALMGDFNVDLIKYATEPNTGEFYDLLGTHSFRPLILQPTRVISKTATLIDNIFINDIS